MSDSPKEQAMQQTCESCGCKWTADDFLPCPVCKPVLAGRCLNCDAKFELSNSGCMDLLRKERAKLTLAREALKKYANPETHSMDENGFAWSGDYFDYETAREALKGLGE